jgi:AraC-like DNA-binding protein
MVTLEGLATLDVWEEPAGAIFLIQTQMESLISLPVRSGLIEAVVELVDVRRDNHDLTEWRAGYGPAAKESVYFTMLVESISTINGPGWRHVLHPGDGLLVLPGEVITAKFQGEKMLRSYNLHFHVRGIESERLLDVFPRFVGLADDSSRLRDSLDGLIAAVAKCDEMLVVSEFYGFLLELSRVDLKRRSRKLSGCVRETLNYMREHAIRHPSRLEIAEAVGMSPGHLSRVIKAETGHTLNHHLRTARVRLAKDLMYSQALNVSETADRMGMDIHSFSKLFKEVTGKSPGQHMRETDRGRDARTPRSEGTQPVA